MTDPLKMAERLRAYAADSLVKDKIDTLERAASMLEALAVQPVAWQPIETAPRDETQVLLYSPMWEMTWGVQIGQFDHLESKWRTGEGMVADNELGFDPDAEYDEHDFEEENNLGPTHWMPLPAPPIASTQDGKTGDGASPNWFDRLVSKITGLDLFEQRKTWAEIEWEQMRQASDDFKNENSDRWRTRTTKGKSAWPTR